MRLRIFLEFSYLFSQISVIGRKRDGRCVVLLAQGTEENTYKKSQSKKKSIFKTIIEKQQKSFSLYQKNPRMVPSDIQPKVEMKEMSIPKVDFGLDDKKKRKQK